MNRHRYKHLPKNQARSVASSDRLLAMPAQVHQPILKRSILNTLCLQSQTLP